MKHWQECIKFYDTTLDPPEVSENGKQLLYLYEQGLDFTYLQK